MELRNIITFCKVHYLKSFSLAAKELGYAQSTVTTQIKMLEQDLGAQLFERIGKNIELTSKGKIFLKYAEDIVELASKSQDAVNELGQPNGMLNIGVAESLCTMILNEPLKIYHEKYPNVDIVVKVATYDDLWKMIKTNAVDLVLMIGEKVNDPDLIHVMYYDESMGILASPQNKLLNKNKVKIKDLENEPLILTEKGCSYRAAFKKQFNLQGLHPRISFEIGGIEAIKKLTMSNLGITLLPYMAVKDELNDGKLKVLDVEDCKFNIMTQLLYHKNKWLSIAMKTFVEELNNWLEVNLDKDTKLEIEKFF